jgi:polyhydroxybutyrate depolymerase
VRIRIASYAYLVNVTQPETGFRTIDLTHDGRNRPYLVLLPAAAGSERLPLVIELHGRGIDAATFDRLTGFGALASEAGFALVAPSAVGEMWNDGRDDDAEAHGLPDDVAYLNAVIDDAVARLPIDPARIYVVGMSNGATMAARLVCEGGGRIAAVAQVAGTAALGVGSNCHRSTPLPLLQIHGSDDRYAPYGGGVASAARRRFVLRVPPRPVVSVEAWASLWIVANGADATPAVSAASPDTTARKWAGPTPASDVVFYRVEGGGHTWPSSTFTLPRLLFGRTSTTFDATRTIWSFFSEHRLQAGSAGGPASS